jgi:hypothetical protein
VWIFLSSKYFVCFSYSALAAESFYDSVHWGQRDAAVGKNPPNVFINLREGRSSTTTVERDLLFVHPMLSFISGSQCVNPQASADNNKMARVSWGLYNIQHPKKFALHKKGKMSAQYEKVCASSKMSAQHEKVRASSKILNICATRKRFAPPRCKPQKAHAFQKMSAQTAKGSRFMKNVCA